METYDLPLVLGEPAPFRDPLVRERRKAAHRFLSSARSLFEGASARLSVQGVEQIKAGTRFGSEEADIVYNLRALFEAAILMFEHEGSKGERDAALDRMERYGVRLRVPGRPDLIAKITVKRFICAPGESPVRIIYHAEQLPEHGWGPSSLAG